MVVLSDEIQPNAEAVRKLFAEYKMTLEGIRQDIAHIRQWMSKQPHLPVIPASKDEEINFWIEGYLRLTKNSVERTKVAIDNYFKGKSLILSEFYEMKDINQYLHSDLYDNLYMMFLPNLTPDGAKIMLYGPTTNDPLLFQQTEFFRRMAVILDIQQKAGIDFTGLRVIIYLRNATLAHITQFNLPYLKKVFEIACKAYPLRIKNSHIIYPPGFVEAAVKIFKPFLSKKVMSRITIHKDLPSLWDDIPKENLPADLGGTLPTMNELHETWKNRIAENYDWFIENQHMVADESKRPDNGKQTGQFGKNGSFRQLCID